MSSTVTYESGPVSEEEYSALNEGVQIPLDESGATCVTYKQYADGRFHFLKVLRQEHVHNPIYRELFRKEYEVGTRLGNECFPKYEKLTETELEVSLQMEFVDGDTLESFLSENPYYFRNESNMERFLVQLLTGLSHLHSHQVVHLDLKPSNIMLTRVDRSVRIVDLGFCHTDQSPFTEGCTTEYAAPEQKSAEKKVDARTDIYAVGVLLKYIYVRVGLSKRFKKIMKRAMQKDPAQRYQSVEEILLEVSKRNNTRYIVFVSIALLLLALSYICIQRYFGNTIFTEQYKKQILTFQVIDKDSMTVKIISAECNDSLETDYQLPYSIVHDGKEYSVIAIGDSLFKNNQKIERLALPTSIRTIGNSAFAKCHNLEIVALPSHVESIGEDCFISCYSLRDVSLSNKIKEIPRTAFVDDSLITSIIIPEGVTHICQDAFTSCASLETVVLPSTLEDIDRGVFFNCISLRTITIPAKVRTLGEYLFNGCTNLDTINCLPTTPPIGTQFIPSNYKGTIIVPPESVEAYRSNPSWSKFNIVGRVGTEKQ